MGNGCGRGRSAGNSVLDWLQRSPPRVALSGFKATRTKCSRAAGALRTCETSLGEQYLPAANRAGSRAQEEKDFQNHAAAGTGQQHPSPLYLRRRDGALFHARAPTAAGAGREHPSPVHLGRCDSALFHAKTRSCAPASGWKRRTAFGPLVSAVAHAVESLNFLENCSQAFDYPIS